MAQVRTRSWKRFAKTSISFAMIPVLLLASPLHAASTIFQVLSAENNEPAGDVKYDQESRSMLVRILDDNKDIVIVTLAFASNVSSSTFASSSTLLRVKFMPYLTNFKGNTGNIWLEAPKSS